MGLDMYLYRFTRLPWISELKPYVELNNFLSGMCINLYPSREVWDFSVFSKKIVNFCRTNLFKSNAPIIYNETANFNFDMITIFEEVCYWRKANQIHGWFVENVQGGNDDCGYYLVTRDHLEELLEIVTDVLDGGADPEEVLPTTEGFFFGSTDYDDFYFEQLEFTKEELTKVLKTTNWDKQYIVYHSSW